MSTIAPQTKVAEHYIMSFGVNLQSQEEAFWMSEYDRIDEFNEVAAAPGVDEASRSKSGAPEMFDKESKAVSNEAGFSSCAVDKVSNDDFQEYVEALVGSLPLKNTERASLLYQICRMPAVPITVEKVWQDGSRWVSVCVVMRIQRVADAKEVVVAHSCNSKTFQREWDAQADLQSLQTVTKAEFDTKNQTDCLGAALAEKASCSNDNISLSTCAGNSDCLSETRTISAPPAFQRHKSQEEFWHFYRSADSLADMPCLQTSKLQDECKLVVENSFRWDRPTECDFWKLPLEPFLDEEVEELPVEKSQQIVKKTPSRPRGVRLAKLCRARSAPRVSFKAKISDFKAGFKAGLTSSGNSKKAQDQDLDQIYAMLAAQIY